MVVKTFFQHPKTVNTTNISRMSIWVNNKLPILSWFPGNMHQKETGAYLHLKPLDKQETCCVVVELPRAIGQLGQSVQILDFRTPKFS